MKRLSCALLLVAGSALAAGRPRIGLALGGGGARGCAHVGVIRVLEQMHVPIDYIAGTSMGAIVGGLYASGMSVDDIERALTTTDWNDALTDRTSFKELSFRRKEDESRYLTALEAGLHRMKLTFPGGLGSAQKLRFLLQSYLIAVADVRDFSKLPIPFKAVAADIETGEAVVLDHGDLAEAIRASMSFPGVFSPIEIDGHLLVDGGIADNIPVDVVRRMGADVVIAVDVGSPLVKRDQLRSLFAISNQVLNMLTQRNSAAQLANADVVITPPLSDYGTFSFTDAKEIIAAGAAEMERQRDRVARFSMGSELYAKRTLKPPPAKRNIDFVGVEGSRRVDPRIIRAKVRTRPGEPLNGERLRQDIARLYGLDDFQTVTFSIRDEGVQHGVILQLRDKPWGPTYVRVGLNLTDDLRGESYYSVIANITRTRVNALGAEWRNDIRAGREEGFDSEFYQPLDFRGRFFVAPVVEILKQKFSLFEGQRRIALYDVGRRGASFDGGVEFEPWGELRVGIARSRVHATVDTGAINLPSGDISHGAIHATFTVSRTDSPTIPHEGGVLLIQYYGARRILNSDDQYSKLSADGNYVFSLGRTTFLAGGGFGANLHSMLPIYDEFRLGGLLSLGGFATGQLHGQRFALIRLGTYYRFRDLPTGIGRGAYVGGFAESGNAWAAGERATLSSLHESLTLVVGADTIIGPILFGYGRAETNADRFYLTIGKTF